MDSENEIFHKDYTAPKVDRSGVVLTVPTIQNFQHFFSGLPLSTHKNGKKFINLVDPAVQRKIKMEKLKARVEKARAAMEKETKKEQERVDKVAADLAKAAAEAISAINPL